MVVVEKDFNNMPPFMDYAMFQQQMRNE
jgi:hypothetical protein